jgi:hypothetical protein
MGRSGRWAIGTSKTATWQKSPNVEKSSTELLQECDRLDAGDLKALAAARILAGDHIIAPDHVASGFGEFGAVAFVSAGRELALLGADQPGKFIFALLAAMRAVESVGLFGFFLVKEVALFHAAIVITEQSGKLQ